MSNVSEGEKKLLKLLRTGWGWGARAVFTHPLGSIQLLHPTNVRDGCQWCPGQFYTPTVQHFCLAAGRVSEGVQYPAESHTEAHRVQRSNQHSRGADCIKCWAEILKRRSDVGVVIFSVCEEMEWMDVMALKANRWDVSQSASVELCWDSRKAQIANFAMTVA